jgi:acyl-CoA synthetase (AMP-forming)/AMP-acid ligase II
LKRVGDFGCRHDARLTSLRRVVSAGAPVPSRVVHRFGMMLRPGVQIFTPYGATEALPVASIGSDEILGDTALATDRGAGVCVGRAVPGVRVEIIRISDDPIPLWTDDLRALEGQIGELVVAGPIVSRAYFRRPDADRLAKIEAPDGVVMHRMGDLGYRDPAGRIWFCGRKAHRVVTREGTLYSIPCEAVFNTHPHVSRTALVGIGSPGEMRPVLCVEPHRWPLRRAERERIEADLNAISTQFEQTKTIHTFLFRRSFPVDIRHNAKIFREQLAHWAARVLR